MPQETNFNISPYFDDFDADKNFHKVLFKPGYPIQARELTTLQSTLQNQVEQFGKNIFKEGSRVYGGQLVYNNPVDAVEIESTFNGKPISLYFDQILNKKIRGSNSGVTAEIVYLLKNNDSERGNYTIYVNYLQSGGDNFDVKFFQDGETLIVDNTPITYGNFSIQVGQGICNTITSKSTSQGSLVKVKSGSYFVRGIFANVNEQTIILDQYSTSPSYKVGFDVIEKVITSDEDESLFDNAQGFSNYAAPGADRFQLNLELTKKQIDNLETDSFIEIVRVENGIPQFFETNPQYNLIRDYLARRTFDEAGNFYVKPFSLFVKDSLNDKVLSNGIYFDNQNTIDGNVPSEDMMVYQIGSGKAYVNGYDVETTYSRLLDVPKPRNTASVTNQVIKYNAGLLAVVNNIYGSASIGLGTTATVSLMSNRLGAIGGSGTSYLASGTEIGVARVYDFIPEGGYLDGSSRIDLRLFDIQTYTQIGLTTSITQTTPAFIKGKRSNASGYLRSNVSSSNILNLYEVSGKFLANEPILINGIDNGRLINSIVDYSLSDVKSIYSAGSAGITTFNGDLVLDKSTLISPSGTQFSISSGLSGISTVTAGIATNFASLLNVGDIISYANPVTGQNIVYNRVNSISAGSTNFTITGLPSIPKVCSGNLPDSAYVVPNIVKISSTFSSRDSSLLTRLNKNNVSSLSLENNEIFQRRSYNVTFSENNLRVPQSGTLDPDLYFDDFNYNNILITYSDGTIEPLSSDKYDNRVGNVLRINGLTKSSGTANVIATIKNVRPNSKTKKLNKASSLVVSYSKLSASGIGTTTLNDGLAYSQVYGLRVQDQEISLNVPDVVRVLSIYESSGISDPALPVLRLVSFTGPSNSNKDFLIGEQIIGQTSGAVGLVVNATNTNGNPDSLEYVYLNTFEFSNGEVVKGKDSTTQAQIASKTIGDKNITQNFLLDNGQRDAIYDYSRIVRKSNTIEPTKKLKVIFQNYTIDNSDTGEFVTANSYSVDCFKNDVPSYRNTRLTDYIDTRPRVSPYSLSTKSPFEFGSRNFGNDGQYSKYILVPGKSIIASYSYYLSRIDRVFLNQDGTFEISQGLSAENPTPPPLKSNVLDIATIFIPPYVYDVKNINVDMSVHKRYRMEDISLLEDRIQTVEKFTTLSMLESKTKNFTIKDAATGLDRFKCGFFVDDFSTHEYHDFQNPYFRSAIDSDTKTLRPLHYTTSLDLQLGSESISGVGQIYNPNVDHSYVTDLGSLNIRRTGDLITLDYNEILYYEQLYASTTESITPFLVKYWLGSIELHPPMDSWIDEKAVTSSSYVEVKTTETRQDQNITTTNNVVQNNVVYVNNPSPNTGIGAFDWGNITRLLNNAIGTRGFQGIQGISKTGFTGTSGTRLGRSGVLNGNTLHLEVWKSSVIQSDYDLINQLLPPDVAASYITEIKTNNGQNRAGIDWTPPSGGATSSTSSDSSTTTQTTSNTTSITIPPQIIRNDSISESISNYTHEIRYLRSRNIEFDIKGLKPVTRFYSFFQGIDVSNYFTPKLLEIQMVSGTGKFQVGEIVESDINFTASKIRFRVCTPNHKTGAYNNPTEVFTLIPYTQQTPPSSYSESSTYINVDTRALQLPSEVEYYGQIAPNMKLIGKTSGAVATISNIRLVSDNSGRLIGSLYIPDPNIVGNPKWSNGENTFTIIDTPTLNSLGKSNETSTVSQSSAQEEFTSSGVTNITQKNILTTRNIKTLSSYNINVNTITNTPNTTTSGSNTGQFKLWETHDPLAQSFYVREDTGIFVTSVDVFFNSKDDSTPVTFQLRPMVNGYPSNIVIPFSEVTLVPDQINLSIDGSVATKITFPSPVYLSGPRQQEVRQAAIGSQQTSEFAMVLLSDSSNYSVFISVLGQNDILTGIKLSQQYTLGSLFKSQNGSTWSASQLEDLKYKIYRADFVSEGLVRFFNPKLSLKNNKVNVTSTNNLIPLSKTIIVGLGSTGYDRNNVVPGVDIVQGSANGILAGIAGSISVGSGVSISNAGIGYTAGTFSGVSLVTETGYGRGATATIGVISNGAGISTVTIVNGGLGYQRGDSLLIPGIGKNVGYGGRVVVTSIGSSNSFVISNVQGSFSSGITTLSYINSSGITIYTGPGVTISGSPIEDPYYDGLHMKIYNQNHGMHSSENYVTINEMRPLNTDTNSKLSTSLSSVESTSISLSSSSGFETFEGATVSPSNPGYVIIGSEIIAYTSISGNNLTNLTRPIDGSKTQSYDSGTYVYKYEFNGISLRRLNKTHNLSQVDNINHPTDIDSFFIKIETSNKDFENTGIGSNRANLYFKETIQTGQSGTLISNNIQFEEITPNVAHIIPAKTDISTKIRTFTGTSVGSDSTTQRSFVDDGFEDISLTETTYFSRPKLICSSVNETRMIKNSPGNRSFSMEFYMSSQDSRVSPVIDTINVSAVLTSNIINDPVGILTQSSYAYDDSTRSLYGDKHSTVYLSKPIRLAVPANALKVLLSASRNDTNDIRVLYQLYRDDAPDLSQNYEFFPGYSNYKTDGTGIMKVIDDSLNDGSADYYTQQTSDRSFRDYEYSVDDLPDFSSFVIKIVMAGTNQATPPIISELRAIATKKPQINRS
jgi:hypothetical protein